MRLVLLLIYRKQYRTIEIPDLVDDFESEFGYKINYYAMRSILGIALSKEYLTKRIISDVIAQPAKFMNSQAWKKR